VGAAAASVSCGFQTGAGVRSGSPEYWSGGTRTSLIVYVGAADVTPAKPISAAAIVDRSTLGIRT
jgi:hypothetical protein